MCTGKKKTTSGCNLQPTFIFDLQALTYHHILLETLRPTFIFHLTCKLCLAFIFDLQDLTYLYILFDLQAVTYLCI